MDKSKDNTDTNQEETKEDEEENDSGNWSVCLVQPTSFK